ncbi:RibD family protein [Thermodesulfobacteriota bacterium]
MKVAIVAAGTLCGRISPVGMGSAEDRALLEQLRDRTDASLIGASTLRVENPEMRGVGGNLSDNRFRAVITGSGKLPVAGKNLFASGPSPLVFTGHDRVAALTDSLGGVAKVKGVAMGKGGLSLIEVIAELAGLGARSLLIEGGGRLNYTALCQGVVDELYYTVTPFLSGHRQASSLVDGPGPLGAPFLPLELLSSRQSAHGELFLHYRVTRRP